MAIGPISRTGRTGDAGAAVVLADGAAPDAIGVMTAATGANALGATVRSAGDAPPGDRATATGRTERRPRN